MLPDNILFSENPSNDLLIFLQKKNYSTVVVLADHNTAKACYPSISDSLPTHSLITVGAGEEFKNLGTCTTIWQQMTNLHLDRHACMVVLGGGVLGDMGGFCAATYKRGIDFVLVPTTLLAQTDASIGGKLGIDFDNFKNHIGVFQQPALTLLYSGFLKTLPEAELRSGFAEIIKHTLISDKAMWTHISTLPLASQNWTTLVKHSVAFKARVTTEDPKEKGLRKILNAGHTIGHAVESYLLASGHRILHGEAIAIGLIAEGYIAEQRGLLSSQELHAMADYILKIFGKVSLDDQQIEAASRLTVQDKKNKGNKILCVLQEGIGNARWDQEINFEEVKQALTFYRTLQM
ncbi:3-dehydroquinate synthase [Pseudochryseolinea flava]|uniref:3-dehydroquinate synthase n=1 Tax=Pseudochryseolinea flava TaxID=2059302 RepID=A0A364XWA0_9BACT|nr:3-dehydroquinate synthase [Pseudochryseolinea flava]RAV97671.1 3-dehydroquinate synthase [Pseudochryseolinea flava]